MTTYWSPALPLPAWKGVAPCCNLPYQRSPNKHLTDEGTWMDTCRHEGKSLALKTGRGHEGNSMQRTNHLRQDEGTASWGRGLASAQTLLEQLFFFFFFLFAGPFTLHPNPAVIPALSHSGCEPFYIPYPGGSTSSGAELFCVWTPEADPA